jgi:hypothetical protein
LQAQDLSFCAFSHYWSNISSAPRKNLWTIFFTADISLRAKIHVFLPEGKMVDEGAGSIPKERTTKREKFVKLAENRTRNAIKAIRIIGKLGNKHAYDYDETDVQKIVRALSKEVEGLRTRMSHTGAKETIEFEL